MGKRKKVECVDAPQARELLAYDPETGIVRWIKDRGGCAKKGRLAGSEDRDGYIVVGIYERQYKMHRVIWLMMTGQWPKGEIDHKNRIRWDNRWRNLRDVDLVTNRQRRHRKTYPHLV